MKFERLLLGLFASFLMVGCSQNEDLPNGGEEQTQAKDSYITVKIKSAPGSFSRAAEGFEDGNATEGKVSNATFFFFDDNGGAVAVNGNLNFKKMTWGVTGDTDSSDDIESASEAVVVLDNPNPIPSKMAVVLNWTHDLSASVTLSQLTDMVVSDVLANEGDDGFMMSNAVYPSTGVDGNSVIMNTVAVTEANFASDYVDAGKNPVVAYVERLAAKVEVTKNTTSNNYNSTLDAFVTGEKIEDKPIYAKIEGWYLNTVNPESKVIKSIDLSWFDTTNGLGWDWYDSNYPYRSYWATSAEPTNGYKYKAFSWESGIVKNPTETNKEYIDWKNMGESLYCLENTSATTTKVLVKATLGTDDNGTFKAFTAYEWFGKYYTDFTALRAAVLANINGRIKGEGGTTVLKDTEFRMLYSDETKHYKITFTLAEGKNDETIGETTLKEIVEETPYAMKWQDGATYYFTNIIHVVDKNISGVVRNHLYKLAITEVKGLGTPGNKPDPDPDPDPEPDPDPIIPDPIYPEDTNTYISAQLNILSWKLVGNNVVLGQ